MCRSNRKDPAGRARRLVAAALSLGLLAACGCAPERAVAGAEGPAEAATLVARRATLEPRLILTGELEAVRADSIYVPRTRSWQLTIRWMEQDGALVQAGQKVLELDNSQFTGSVEQKKLERSRAHNELLRREADVAGEIYEQEFLVERRRIELEQARIEAAVPEVLRPRREHQEYQLKLARAGFEHAKAEEGLSTARRASQAEIEELRIALRQADEEIATAERAIAALSIEAPRGGILVVSENDEGRKFQVGDNVWVGLPVMRIPDLSEMKVVARLSDVDDGRIAIDAPAECTLDAYPDPRFTGRVTEIAPIAQEDHETSLRRSFRVVIALDASDPQRMRPGLSVRAEIRLPEVAGGIVVPRAALDLSTEPPRARLADGSTAEVRLGPCSALECAVEAGLAEGSRLRSAG